VFEPRGDALLGEFIRADITPFGETTWKLPEADADLMDALAEIVPLATLPEEEDADFVDAVADIMPLAFPGSCNTFSAAIKARAGAGEPVRGLGRAARAASAASLMAAACAATASRAAASAAAIAAGGNEDFTTPTAAFALADERAVGRFPDGIGRVPEMPFSKIVSGSRGGAEPVRTLLSAKPLTAFCAGRWLLAGGMGAWLTGSSAFCAGRWLLAGGMGAWLTGSSAFCAGRWLLAAGMGAWLTGSRVFWPSALFTVLAQPSAAVWPSSARRARTVPSARIRCSRMCTRVPARTSPA
jgi:hypothetical protein